METQVFSSCCHKKCRAKGHTEGSRQLIEELKLDLEDLRKGLNVPIQGSDGTGYIPWKEHSEEKREDDF